MLLYINLSSDVLLRHYYSNLHFSFPPLDTTHHGFRLTTAGVQTRHDLTP
jgi:hypothetical protein